MWGVAFKAGQVLPLSVPSLSPPFQHTAKHDTLKKNNVCKSVEGGGDLLVTRRAIPWTRLRRNTEKPMEIGLLFTAPRKELILLLTGVLGLS